MLWSPTKKTGQKKQLEAIEEGDDSESEEEEGEIGEQEQSSGSGGMEGGNPFPRCAQEEDQTRILTQRAGEVNVVPEGPGTTSRGNVNRRILDTGRTEEGSWSPAPAADAAETHTNGRPTRLAKVTEHGGQHPGEGRESQAIIGRCSSPVGKRPNRGEKNGRGGKAQRLCQPTLDQADADMVTEGDRLMGSVPPPPAGSTHGEVIPEMQLTQLKSTSIVYKDILASIGLDNPTSSHETGGDLHKANFDKPHLNIPIRNSAASLMALGKHVFTPRQGKLWENKSKSPLGS